MAPKDTFHFAERVSCIGVGVQSTPETPETAITESLASLAHRSLPFMSEGGGVDGGNGVEDDSTGNDEPAVTFLAHSQRLR